MNADKFIEYIKDGKINLLEVKDVLDIIALDQKSIKKILHFSLLDDKYINITKALWSKVEDGESLTRYDLYCHLLRHYKFSEKTARYICLKERDLKILHSEMLGKCGTVKAVDFLMNAYNLSINNIIEGISICSYEGQIPIMEHLMTRLNELQKNTALNKFITAYIGDCPRDLTLVAFVLKQKKVWNSEILENERIKKITFYTNMESKLSNKQIKTKSQKI